ncbi:MAG: VWA domain-containing protein [Granulosicoccus sp.]
MNAFIREIVWALPWAWLVLPLPLLFYWIVPPITVANDRALRIPDVSDFSELSNNTRVTRRGWFGLLLLAAMWLALVMALARPQSFGESTGTPVSGRDLLLGIDISVSMRESDLYAGNTRATRMAVVKQVASQFIERRSGDRIGLIMFGSQAYVQAPLTFDHQTVQHFLAEATVGLAGRSTAIGDAVGLGVKRLRDRSESARVMVLLTDGENSAGVVEPVEAARMAAESGIRIHTIGVGSKGRGFRRSEIDEETLQSIATLTGGKYFRAHNAEELEQIYLEIDRLEPAESDSDNYRPLQELFFWPLGVALGLSMLWLVLRLWLRKPSVAVSDTSVVRR